MNEGGSGSVECENNDVLSLETIKVLTLLVFLCSRKKRERASPRYFVVRVRVLLSGFCWVD